MSSLASEGQNDIAYLWGHARKIRRFLFPNPGQLVLLCLCFVFKILHLAFKSTVKYLWSMKIIWNMFNRTCKHPTYRFDGTIVWERSHFWRSEINIDYCLIQCIIVFCSSHQPIFKLSLLVPWIDSTFLNVWRMCYVKQLYI